jgi:hypothetical protein
MIEVVNVDLKPSLPGALQKGSGNGISFLRDELE